MKIRQHRGGLKESMDTVVEIEATFEAVAKYASAILGYDVDAKHIRLESYGIDYRIDWVQWIVMVNDGVLGFCNENVN